MTSLAEQGRKLKSELDQLFGEGGILGPAEIEAVCREVGHSWRCCFWSPAMIVLTFLRQVLSGNCSCRETVAWAVAESAAGDTGIGKKGAGWMSGDPSAYAQARQRLPLKILTSLGCRVGVSVRASAGAALQWCGRRVYVIDGSTETMPDTPSLQKAFPQPPDQKSGCGFPMARVVAVFCWASGALMELVIDSLKRHELTLLRRIWDRLERGSVVVADRLYCSYYDMAGLQLCEVDSVFRMHVSRSADLRRGMRLGKNDHRIEWKRPAKRSPRVTAKDWAKIPKAMTVRHVRILVEIPGFRSRRIELVTTLLDPVVYPAEKLAELYRDRWMAELNMRSLKTTLKMDVLKCKSPEMVRKELAMYMIAYNLIRTLMWQAAATHGKDPRRMSFAGTVQRTAAMLPYLRLCETARQRCRLLNRLLEMIAADTLTDRPNRLEPRSIKRRTEKYPLLTVPRATARKRPRKAAA